MSENIQLQSESAGYELHYYWLNANPTEFKFSDLANENL